MSRYAMCPDCGHRLRRDLDSYGNWDGETYVCDYCSGSTYDDDDDSEGLSADDAALIWMSSGMDEDQMFGYSEKELREALD